MCRPRSWMLPVASLLCFYITSYLCLRVGRHRIEPRRDEHREDLRGGTHGTQALLTVLILWLCLPEVLLARVVLEAGEIDSGKVRVGVFAEVVYGKGKRDPVSGQWEKLDHGKWLYQSRGRGAFDHSSWRRCFGKEQIAFARIQKLIIAEPSRVVLEAGEIDSGKVRVGAFAEVVYGKGDAGSGLGEVGETGQSDEDISRPWTRRV